MTQPSFGNPVAGLILPRGTFGPDGALRPTGDTRFVVTSTFAEHVASGRGPGVDIGNARCGAPLIAQCNGRVGTAGFIGASKVVRVRSTEWPGYETAVAHLATIDVVVGQMVTLGQRLGTLGMTGANACHCHVGLKHLVNGVWVEIDSWPLLAQNQGADMIPIPTAAFTRLGNKKTTTIHPANFWSERVTSAVIMRTFPIGTVFYPTWSANDGSLSGGSSLWYYGAMYDDSPAGYTGGWIHSSNLGTLVDATPPPTPIDCGPLITKAVGDAVTPLNAQITTLTTDLGVANEKITKARIDLA